MAYITPVLNWDATKYYNFSDFNRVENNTIETSNLLNANGYKCALASTITGRTNVSLDFYDSLNRIENNISLLQQILGYALAGWLTPVTNWTWNMPFDFNTANRLEQNIDLVYNTINNIVKEYKYSGAPNSICGTDAMYL